ncbi:hypothetical protein ACSQ76_04150 [Roseovarius sp. B08]|uniref:hypothetical protein n=1 Tax=Roseovarius sp. B08 TaxID=3449223 RepID=UPI003EDC7182
MLRYVTGAGIGLLMLAGCANGPMAPDRSFRDTGQPLSVTTRGNGMQDMGGPWFVRGYFPGDGGLAMVTLVPDLRGQQAVEFRTEACLLSGDCETDTEIWLAKPLGQNRWQLNREGEAPRQMWVVWVDDDFRTAAIRDARWQLWLDPRPSPRRRGGPAAGGGGDPEFQRL